jgi:site-specific recombinase XerC
LPEYGQARRFILSSGARIDETLQLRSDKVFIDEKQVVLKGKGGRVRRIRVLRASISLSSAPWAARNAKPARHWPDGWDTFPRALT